MMVGAKLIELSGNSTLLLDKAPGELKDFSFFSDINNENRRECGVWAFSFKATSRTSTTTTGRR